VGGGVGGGGGGGMGGVGGGGGGGGGVGGGGGGVEVGGGGVVGFGVLWGSVLVVLSVVGLLWLLFWGGLVLRWCEWGWLWSVPKARWVRGKLAHQEYPPLARIGGG